MTAISLGQPARSSRFGMRAITAAINGGRLSRDSGRYLVGPVQLREQFEMGNVTFAAARICRWVCRFPPGQGRPLSSMIPLRPRGLAP